MWTCAALRPYPALVQEKLPEILEVVYKGLNCRAQVELEMRGEDLLLVELRPLTSRTPTRNVGAAAACFLYFFFVLF